MLDSIFTLPLLVLVYQNKMKGLLPGVILRLFLYSVLIYWTYFPPDGKTIALIAYHTLTLLTNVCFALVSKANKLYFICSMFVSATITSFVNICYLLYHLPSDKDSKLFNDVNLVGILLVKSAYTILIIAEVLYQLFRRRMWCFNT